MANDSQVNPSNDDVQEILDDLRHDLGKYIALPLSFLPADADDAAIREAIRQGILQTRRQGSSIRTAHELYVEFVDEVGHDLSHLPGWTVLQDAMSTVMAWIDILDDKTEPVDRVAAERELKAVSQAIRQLEAQLNNE